MDQYYLDLMMILTFLPLSSQISWMFNFCERDSDCPVDKCCRIINTMLHHPTASGLCVYKGQCYNICHTDTDCGYDECCRITHAGAYYGSCSPRIRNRKRGCLATTDLVPPIGQHYACPCDRGLKCTGTGVQSGYGEEGICKDFTNPVRCRDDTECSTRRCCRYGYCVVPFGGSTKHRCGV